MIGSLHVVEVIGKWPAAVSCIMFFLVPKTVDSDRLVNHRCEWVRADIMG